MSHHQPPSPPTARAAVDPASLPHKAVLAGHALDDACRRRDLPAANRIAAAFFTAMLPPGTVLDIHAIKELVREFAAENHGWTIK